MLTEILLDRLPMAATSVVSPFRVSPKAEQSVQKVSSANPAAKVELSEEGMRRSKEANGKELSDAERQEVDELKQRDREVRQHEQAHMSAAGGYAIGGPKYEFQAGPDGKRYAVGGHVNLDTSEENTPEETLRKATVLQQAATAAAEPSDQDRSVAAQASQMAANARKEIMEEKAGGNSQAFAAYSSSMRFGRGETNRRAWMA